jgi:hypothetical protein
VTGGIIFWDEQRKKMGRKSKYSEAIAQEICDRIAEGETLSSICKDKHMPDTSTVWRWRKENNEFSQCFARAREIGFDAIADEALRIADTPEIGEVVEYDEAGKVVKRRTEDMLQHRKLQCWMRLQLLSKWDPKRYGDRTAVDHGVQDDLAEKLIAARRRISNERE